MYTFFFGFTKREAKEKKKKKKKKKGRENKNEKPHTRETHFNKEYRAI